jgi:hypothetical protein
MTQIKTPDLSLTGSLLVVQYNEMVATAIDLGLTAKEVNRFATNQKGCERTEALHKAIQERAEALRVANEEAAELEARTGRPANTENTPAPAEETTSQGNTAPEDTQEETCERLPDESEEDFMARKAKAKKRVTKTTNKPKTGGGKKVKSTDGSTIREMTEEYNRLVPAAKKAGITWAKHHTSNFESKDKATIATKKLKDAMKKASA